MSDKNSPKELRAMSAKELSALVRSLREELFNLRLQQATGQLENRPENPHRPQGSCPRPYHQG